MELMVIAVIALIVLGPTRLPDAARSVGRGMREMRDSFQGLTGDDDEDEDFEREVLEHEPDDDSSAAPAASPGRS
jgi:sec-independent protein translocase protein TatA